MNEPLNVERPLAYGLLGFFVAAAGLSAVFFVWAYWFS
jgi:hypothetical protein